MTVYDIIRFPHITEKTTLQEGSAGGQVVTFKVHPNANKHQIREAVETVFNVKVDKVRTQRVHGKPKRQGRNVGRRPDWKKAQVTLKAGDRIEFFEGV